MRREYRNKGADEDATRVPKSRKNVKKPFSIQFEWISKDRFLSKPGWHTWKRYAKMEHAVEALAVLRRKEADGNNAYNSLFRYRIDPRTCTHDGDPCTLCTVCLPS